MSSTLGSPAGDIDVQHEIDRRLAGGSHQPDQRRPQARVSDLAIRPAVSKSIIPSARRTGSDQERRRQKVPCFARTCPIVGIGPGRRRHRRGVRIGAGREQVDVGRRQRPRVENVLHAAAHPCPPRDGRGSDQEVTPVERRAPGERDLEIRPPVAVHVAGEHAALEPQLACDVVEARGADEREVLVAGENGIGVDGLEVDVVDVGAEVGRSRRAPCRPGYRRRRGKRKSPHRRPRPACPGRRRRSDGRCLRPRGERRRRRRHPSGPRRCRPRGGRFRARPRIVSLPPRPFSVFAPRFPERSLPSRSRSRRSPRRPLRERFSSSAPRVCDALLVMSV